MSVKLNRLKEERARLDERLRKLQGRLQKMDARIESLEREEVHKLVHAANLGPDELEKVLRLAGYGVIDPAAQAAASAEDTDVPFGGEADTDETPAVDDAAADGPEYAPAEEGGMDYEENEEEDS